MATRILFRAIAIVVAFSLATITSSAHVMAMEPPASTVRSGQIDVWIQQLGHPDYQVRENASQNLTKCRYSYDAIRSAAKSTDPEVAQRAIAILRELDRLLLVQLKSDVRDWKPDLFVERAMRFNGSIDDFWQVVTDFGSAAYHIEGRTGEKWEDHRRNLPDRNFSQEKIRGPIDLTRDAEVATELRYYLFRGPTLTVGSRADLRLAVVSGELRGVGLAGMIFVNGGVRIIEGPPRLPRMNKSTVIGGVLVCDGDVKYPFPDQSRQDRISHAVLVCRGNVHCPDWVSDSVILATGDVHIPEGATVIGTTIRTGGTIRRPARFNSRASKLEENVANSTKPFRFFELPQVGLEVAAAERGVRVEKITDKSAMAEAGIRTSDLVLAVDGNRADSPATLRKLLRSAVALGYGTVTIRRDGSTRHFPVLFPD